MVKLDGVPVIFLTIEHIGFFVLCYFAVGFDAC